MMLIDTILIVFVLLSLTVFYFLIRTQIQQSKTDPTLTNWLRSIQQSIETSNRHSATTIQQNYRELFSRLDQATSVISDLKKEAGAFSEVSRSMKEVQDYLKSPKLRGNLGEQVLSDLISQIFPPENYRFQYKFKSGQAVDAAIFTKGGVLPIDSKFPMENFQKLYTATNASEKQTHLSAFVRDVKKHLKDISSKYILEQEGTLDFALIYIPSESVYYEFVCQTELMDYSRDLRVYPVSPTTLYANLQTILLSLESQKLAEKSKEILPLLRAVAKDHEKVSDNLNLLTRHLTNAYNSLSDTNQSHLQLGQKLESVKSLKSGKTDE